MLIIIISRSSLKLGHGGSKTRSLGQILETPCVHSKWHSFDLSSIFVRLLVIIISRSDLKLALVKSKTRSLGQIVEKPVPSRGHSFDLKFMKLCQKINHHNI